MDQSIHATGRSSSPINASQSAYQRARSRTPPPRPTTPLRPPSRSSLRSSSRHRPVGLSTTPTSSTSKKPTEAHEVYTGPSPLDALEPAFAELADGMADLEANLMHVQIMHESIARFNENFAGFLHGLRLNAFCVDFPEAPVQESFRRARERAADAGPGPTMAGGGGAAKGKVEDVDQTFLTTDTSFVDNPPASSARSSRYATPAPSRASARGSRGGASGVPRGSNIGRGRASGLARATTRGRGTFR